MFSLCIFWFNSSAYSLGNNDENENYILIANSLYLTKVTDQNLPLKDPNNISAAAESWLPRDVLTW